MTEQRPGSSMRRRWLLWGGVGAIAAVVTAVIVVAMVNMSSAAPTPAPTTEVAGPTPTASPSPASPSPSPTCDASAADFPWTDTSAVDLPPDGEITASPVVALTGVGSGAELRAFPIDQQRVGVIVQTRDGDAQSSISVVDRESGSVAWTTEVAGAADVVSTPQSTGVGEVLVLSVWNSDEIRLLSLDLSDGTVRTERQTSADHSGLYNRSGLARIVVPGLTSFFTTDRETLHLIDASTLEDVWTVSGDEYDVGNFEGGVPFAVVGDVAFVGPHALDAATGESLGWESSGGAVFPGGGVTLQLPFSDGPALLPLSGLDTTSGESCWSRDVRSVAAGADDVWIITEDHAVEQIDPQTGKTLDVIVDETSADEWLIVESGRLVLVTGPDLEASHRVFEGGQEAGEMTSPDVISASGQVLSIEEDEEVTARSLDGAEAWRFADSLEHSFSGGVLLGTETDADRGSLEVFLYH